MAKSLREAILSAPFKVEQVHVPEWNLSVPVRGLSAKMRTKMIDVIVANERDHRLWQDDQARPVEERVGVARTDLFDQTILSVLFTIVDDEGVSLFSIDDYEAFTRLDYDTLTRLFLAGRNLRGTPVSAEDQKKSSD